MKLSTENYKGTRDFYPEDMRLRNYLFETMKKVVTAFGYEEYDGPMIESIDLYRAKTGEEIVGNQVYDFIDKGKRHVSIRPEMTPTLARMVAKKSRELPRPIRWFSIPNLWRYEQPGRGRLREHWQLNVDVFGEKSFTAEVEILQVAVAILKEFGAKKEQFSISISNRKILDSFFLNRLNLDPNKSQSLSKLLDKKNKISEEEFSTLAMQIVDSKEKLSLIQEFLNANLETIGSIAKLENVELEEFLKVFSSLEGIGLDANIHFDPSVIRGFDYYTGTIFEIFDTNPENKRSLYGGGRYDNLIGIFSNEELSGIGFGLGDVTLENFLRTHGLLPELQKQNTIYFPILGDGLYPKVLELSTKVRDLGFSCEVSLSAAKLTKHISVAEKKQHAILLIFGTEEQEKNLITIKHLHKRTQETVPLENLGSKLREFSA